jgi:hypothetical protein
METTHQTQRRQAAIPAHQLRAISVAANVDPRTIRRVVAGKPTAGCVRARIVEAIRAAGFGHLVHEDDETTAAPVEVTAP